MGAVTKAIVGVVAGIVLAGVLIFATMAVRAANFGGPLDIEEVELPSPPTIDTAVAVKNLSEAIRFRTVTLKAGDPATPEAATPWLELHAWMETTYPRVHQALTKEIVANYTLLYTWQGSDSSLDPIVLMAHQDVVPINMGTIDDWERPPFSGAVANGYIYGRGTLDDKGSMIAIMEGVEALVRDGFQPRRTIILSFGHDEEVSGGGAQEVVKLFKQRGITPHMVLDEGFFVIEDSPFTGKPMGIIGVAEKGYLTVEIVAKAQGGHSSAPPRNSGNVQLAKAILALERNQMPADFSKPPTSELFRVVGPHMPFSQKLAFANLWAFQSTVESALAGAGAADAMVRTTTAPTMLSGSIKENVLPQLSVATVNFRVHPNDSIESVLAHIETVIADIDGVSLVRPEGDGIGSEPSPVSPTDNKAYAVLNAVAVQTGEGAPAAPGLVIGATDARYMSEVSGSVYRFQPSLVTMDELSGFHGTNERQKVENVRRMAEGYAQIIMVMGSE